VSTFFFAIIGTLAFLALVGGAIYVGWRIAVGYTKLREAREVKPHEHYWSPWDDHEVALYDGAELVRYAPGQLRTCLDSSCNAEDVRYVGGQVTSGEKDLG
jgi:hypothetical protein